MAAVLGLRMAGSISRVLNASLDQATFWSDSMNVVWWIRGRSRSFKPFVANRVGEIQTATDPKQWRYVPTNKNPADLLTRGLKLSELTKNENWWTGTDFLGHEESEWPVNKVVIEQGAAKVEVKRSNSELPDRFNHLYGGPFVTIQGRRSRRQKRYFCLFPCLATRAVHLEMAFGLDTDSFLNAFYRMVNRRGLPREMLSDNGTNFVAAERELRGLVEALDQSKIAQSTVNKGVMWHFNPPLAPHFGGVHETMIKVAKRPVNAVLGNADVTDEELTTAFTGAEALLNSRPVTYQSANPEDDIPLTTNHFLIGQIGGQFAPESVDETNYSLKKRWRRVQELVRHFWHRWLREWIPSLSNRRKWLKGERDLQSGDVVLVMSPYTPRGHWPLGRIVKVYQGKDGHVRVAKVQVGKSQLTRPILKLCPLEL